MLIDINVKNFRSFKDEQVFSMEIGAHVRQYPNAVLSNQKVKLLKSALLFGGNANGKTNALLALLMLRTLVINPTVNTRQELPVDTFFYNDDPTEFTIRFVKNQIEFEYQLAYSRSEVIAEKLMADGTIIFERMQQDFIKLPQNLELVKATVRSNQLLLFVGQANNDEFSKLAFEWFLDDVIFVNTDAINNQRFERLNDFEFKDRFLPFLRAADFNIIDIEVRERPVNRTNLRFTVTDNIGGQFEHNTEEATYFDIYSEHEMGGGLTKQIHFDNESTGTKVFMLIAMYILENSNNSKVLLIDEFDRSFHVELAQALLDVFNAEQQKNQFILTTHELSLMDYNLRQDQIWFAEKGADGATDIFSVFDFEDSKMKRSDASYKRRYLEGRFGAKQIINTTAMLEGLGE